MLILYIIIFEFGAFFMYEYKNQNDDENASNEISTLDDNIQIECLDPSIISVCGSKFEDLILKLEEFIKTDANKNQYFDLTDLNTVNDILSQITPLLSNPTLADECCESDIIITALQLLFSSSDTPESTLNHLTEIGYRLLLRKLNEKTQFLPEVFCSLAISTTGNLQKRSIVSITNILVDLYTQGKENDELVLNINGSVSQKLLDDLMIANDPILISNILNYFDNLLFLISRTKNQNPNLFAEIKTIYPKLAEISLSFLDPYNEIFTASALQLLCQLCEDPLVTKELLSSENIFQILFHLNEIHHELFNKLEESEGDELISQDMKLSHGVFQLIRILSMTQNFSKTIPFIFEIPDFADILKFELHFGHKNTKEIVFDIIELFIDTRYVYFQENGIIDELFSIYLNDETSFTEKSHIVRIILTFFDLVPDTVIEPYLTEEVVMSLCQLLGKTIPGYPRFNICFCDVFYKLCISFPHVLEFLRDDEIHDELDEYINDFEMNDSAIHLLKLIEDGQGSSDEFD